MLSEFNPIHNVTKATKNIYSTRSESAIDHSTVTIWSQKFYSNRKNVDDQARSSRSKSVDFEADPVSSIRRVSGELCISVQCGWAYILLQQKHPELSS